MTHSMYFPVSWARFLFSSEELSYITVHHESSAQECAWPSISSQLTQHTWQTCVLPVAMPSKWGACDRFHGEWAMGRKCLKRRRWASEATLRDTQEEEVLQTNMPHSTWVEFEVLAAELVWLTEEKLLSAAPQLTWETWHIYPRWHTGCKQQSLRRACYLSGTPLLTWYMVSSDSSSNLIHFSHHAVFPQMLPQCSHHAMFPHAVLLHVLPHVLPHAVFPSLS